MKKLLAVIALAVSALAQDTFGQDNETISKLVEVNNVDPRFLGEILSSFGVVTRISNVDSKFITLKGSKASVELAEQALKRLDHPRKNIEVTFQILSASTQPGGDKLPAQLANVVTQLKSAFVYQSFKLVETMQVRTREGPSGAEASSVINLNDPVSRTGFFQAKFRSATLGADEKGMLVRLDGLHFGARMPLNRTLINEKTKLPETQFAESGVNADIDIREGQTAVVGRANLDGKEGAFFLIVNAKVVD